MRKFAVGDRVTCLLEQHAYYSDYGGRPVILFKPGMVGTVAAVVPKVRVVKGPGKDARPYFLVVDFHSPETGEAERVGLNFCNARKAKA